MWSRAKVNQPLLGWKLASLLSIPARAGPGLGHRGGD